MEQILPVLEGQLRRFRRNAGTLAAAHPRLAGRLAAPSAMPDAHVDRLVQGLASLQARTGLALARARLQQDEHLLERHFPGQLRPFPECRIVPAARNGAAIVGARYHPDTQGAIDLELDVNLELDLDLGPPAPTLDLWIDGDAAMSAVLRSALLGAGGGQGGAGAAVRREGGAGWQAIPSWPFAPTGLDPSEALLPRPPGAHAGLALLREYFMFPARFNVLRLDLSPFGAAGRWTLRIPAPGCDAPAARLLESLRTGHLRAGWVARACLRQVAAAPVRLDGRRSEYPLAIAPGMELFSIDRVLVDGAAAQGWTVRRVEAAAPGHQWRIAFRREGAGQAGAVASIDVSCCRRRAILGQPARGAGCRWQLRSLLALDQLPSHAEALRELMATQALNGTPASDSIIHSVRGLVRHPVLLQQGGGAPLQGTEWRLQVDEGAFDGGGLLLFAQVLDRFFGECAHINTFTRLVLASARTGEELMRCKARNADTVLE
jgi:type VI protein secretion system component VasA